MSSSFIGPCSATSRTHDGLPSSSQVAAASAKRSMRSASVLGESSRFQAHVVCPGAMMEPVGSVTSSARWWAHESHGHGRGPLTQSALVTGRGGLSSTTGNRTRPGGVWLPPSSMPYWTASAPAPTSSSSLGSFSVLSERPSDFGASLTT